MHFKAGSNGKIIPIMVKGTPMPSLMFSMQMMLWSFCKGNKASLKSMYDLLNLYETALDQWHNRLLCFV